MKNATILLLLLCCAAVAAYGQCQELYRINLDYMDIIVEENMAAVMEPVADSIDWVSGLWEGAPYTSTLMDTVCVGRCIDFLPYGDYPKEMLEEGETTHYLDYQLLYFEGAEPEIVAELLPQIRYDSVGVFFSWHAMQVRSFVFPDDPPNTGLSWGHVVVVYCPPLPAFSGAPLPVCAGAGVDFEDLSEGAPTWWEWRFEGGSPAHSSEQHPSGIVYDTPGSYGVRLVAGNPSGSDTLLLEDYVQVEAAAAGWADGSREGYTIDEGEAVQLAACGMSPGYRYEWVPAAGISCTDCPAPTVRPVDNTTYSCTISHAGGTGGCGATCLYDIRVIPSRLSFPNAFSPNGDGLNDGFYPVGEFSEMQLFEVYNRWGERVHSAPGLPWDGSCGGAACPVGAYAWRSVYLNNTGKLQTDSGMVFLVR